MVRAWTSERHRTTVKGCEVWSVTMKHLLHNYYQSLRANSVLSEKSPEEVCIIITAAAAQPVFSKPYLHSSVQSFGRHCIG